MSRNNNQCVIFVLILIVMTTYASDSTTGYAAVSIKERLLPSGTYIPFFSPRPSAEKGESKAPPKPVTLNSFWLDSYPVTNGEYAKFLKKNSQWRRSKISRIFADESYLKKWVSDLNPGNASVRNQPVTHVSWFAANAFCQSYGKELPTTEQWEYAAEDLGREPEKKRDKILAWYSVPNQSALSIVGKQLPNGYGVYDLHGLIWEWTLDFGAAMMSSEPRSSGTKDEDLFCGAGSLSALNASDYATFMRYSFRSSLQAHYTTANLGFRCARKVTGR